MLVKLVVIEGRGRCELITCARAGLGWRGNCSGHYDLILEEERR